MYHAFQLIKYSYFKFLSQENTTFQLPNFQEVSMLILLLKAKVQEQVAIHNKYITEH